MLDNKLSTGSEYILIGSQFSVFTVKARAYLKWKGVPFKEVLASDIVWKGVIQNIGGANQIPVLLIPNSSQKIGFNVIQDTKDIIDYIENTHPPSISKGIGLAAHPLVPSTPKRGFVSMMFELLADEWLIIQAMYWRWGPGIYERQEKFLAFDFGNVASGGIADYEKTISLGAKRGSRFKGLCVFLGITSTTSPFIDKQFHKLLSALSLHFAKYPFLLGNEISLADIAFIGTFAGHLSRDPVPSYILKTEAPLVYNWVERVMCQQQWASKDSFQFTDDWKGLTATYGTPKRGANAPELREDEVPESSLEIAKLFLVDYMPVLKDTLRHMTQYILKNTEMETALIKLPRTIGSHQFKLRVDDSEVQEERAVQAHAVWLFQRILDRAYKTAEQRQAGDSWLEAVGGQEAVDTWRQCIDEWKKGGWQVGRSQNQLIARKQRVKARL